jgi:hypothetical protein
MGDATCRRRNGQMEFRLGDGPPSGRFRPLYCGAGGAPAPLDVLLERYAEEGRDDASAGQERAAQRS